MEIFVVIHQKCDIRDICCHNKYCEVPVLIFFVLAKLVYNYVNCVMRGPCRYVISLSLIQ